MKENYRYGNLVLRIIFSMLLLLAASGVGFLFRRFHLPEANIAIVYLLAVLLTTLLIPGYAFGFITSVRSAFSFNFLFTVPYLTFTTNAPSYIITFIIMTITTFISSSLASHAKISAREASEREQETRALYTLNNRLSEAAGISDITAIAADTIRDFVCKKAECMWVDENGLLGDKGVASNGEEWPVVGREGRLGLVRIPGDQAQLLDQDQTRLLQAMIESIAMAMDRVRSAQEHTRAQTEARQERYRSNLLRSISHDLRTPLSGILGASEMLSNMISPEDRPFAIVQGIAKDAHWLYALVENVLSLTRLQDGHLVINKQLEAVEEVMGGALAYMGRRYPEYEIQAQAPDTLLMAPMDARLINQVLVNLLDNAIKHTPPHGEISVTAKRDTANNQAVFTVSDRGSGIAPDDLEHVFQMFYTSHPGSEDARAGIGLGLSICESIIKAHGGTITAQNRPDGAGAVFCFTLPLEEN